MAEIPGVKITGRLVPTDTTDTYSATSELYHHGGYKSVATEAERLAITSDRRKEGMLVYQLDTKDYWTLEGGILDIHWKTTIPNITETYRQEFPQDAGVISSPGPAFIDNGNGTATVEQSVCNLYSTDNFTGALASYTVPENTMAFTDGTEQYVCVKLNAGSAEYYVESDHYAINASNVVLVYVVWRQGNELHSVYNGDVGNGLANKSHRATLMSTPYRRCDMGGLDILETATPDPRTITVSGGLIFTGSSPVDVLDFDSSVDRMTLAYHTGAGWQYTDQLVYDNLNINPDGLGLVEMTNNNKYGVRWFYRSIGDAKQVFYVLGQNEFKSVAEAELEQPRSDIPIVLARHCMLVGRSIIQKNASSGVMTSAFARVFKGAYLTAVTTDDSLTGLGTSASPLSVVNWKPAVADLTSLPTIGNTIGDVRKVLDTFLTYYWNGTAWVQDTPDVPTSDSIGLLKQNYLKTSNLLDTSVWTLNLIDPITITETTEEIGYSSCIDNKWYKFTASEYFTATVPYHVYNQFKTGINKLYTFTTYLRGSFEAYDWSFDIYTTTGDLVKHFDVNHNTQHISNVELDSNTNYIFGIQYLIYGVGAPSSFYVGDVGLYAAEGQTTNHNTLLNKDAAGNHQVIRPLENSTTSFQHQNAAGSSILNIDSVNNEIMFGGGATTRKVDIVINGELKHQQWYEQSKAHTALAGNRYFKTAFQMYMGNQSSALFTKVYLNDVELVFGTDWVWGTNEYWQGSNLKYFDSVEIITPATGTYKVTYYEILSNYKPDFAMSRSDNVVVKNKIPPRQFYARIGNTPVWQKMNGYTRLSSYSHAVSYWSTSGTPMVKTYNYSDMLYCKNFPKNASLGSWTLEVFKVGNHYTNNSTSDGLGTGSGMCFVKQLTTNNFAFPTLNANGYPAIYQDKTKGIYKFRLHNITNNEVTEFWDRSLIFRMIVLKSTSNVAPNFFNQFLGRILVPRLI